MTASDARRWTHKHEPEFDRTVCPEPCGAMHNYCTHCGLLLDDCPHERRDRADG